MAVEALVKHHAAMLSQPMRKATRERYLGDATMYAK
jgi:hypothetical protein